VVFPPISTNRLTTIEKKSAVSTPPQSTCPVETLTPMLTGAEKVKLYSSQNWYKIKITGTYKPRKRAKWLK